jgi:hypothetical protein
LIQPFSARLAPQQGGLAHRAMPGTASTWPRSVFPLKIFSLMYVTELTFLTLRATMNLLIYSKLTARRNISVGAAFAVSSERDQYHGLSKH